MCKIRTQNFQCTHTYIHRVSSCLRRKSPQDDYTCSNPEILHRIKIKSFCPPCSKREWTDHFWQQYKEVELRCGENSKTAQDVYAEFERACDALDEFCSRDQPFWSKMSIEDYVAAGSPVGDVETDERGGKSEKQKRKDAMSSLYYLRRRQSNFKEAVATAPSKGLVEKAEATDRDLLQQLFARTTISTPGNPLKTVTSLAGTEAREEMSEERVAEASSLNENTRPIGHAPRCQGLLPDRATYDEANNPRTLGSTFATEESQKYQHIRHDSVTEKAKGKQRQLSTHDTR